MVIASKQTRGDMSINQSNLFEADPVLGAYLSHHPSRRDTLLLRGGAIYTIGVVVIQILSLNLNDTWAAIVVPFAYALIALIGFWYVAHLWNREVILYERGFTYREGSYTGYFKYPEIVMLRSRIERVMVFGFFPITVYDYTLISEHDETLRITNLYSEVAKLTARLDGLIARDRLPVIRKQLEQEKTISFGAIQLNKTGIECAGQSLTWQDFGGYQIRQGQLVILKGESEWQSVTITALENLVVLIATLKAFSPAKPA